MLQSPNTFFVLFFETGFLCVTTLVVLELALVDHAGLELTEIRLPPPPKCREERYVPPLPGPNSF